MSLALLASGPGGRGEPLDDLVADGHVDERAALLVYNSKDILGVLEEKVYALRVHLFLDGSYSSSIETIFILFQVEDVLQLVCDGCRPCADETTGTNLRRMQRSQSAFEQDQTI